MRPSSKHLSLPNLSKRVNYSGHIDHSQRGQEVRVPSRTFLLDPPMVDEGSFARVTGSLLARIANLRTDITDAKTGKLYVSGSHAKGSFRLFLSPIAILFLFRPSSVPLC
jgi:hypothetical protein